VETARKLQGTITILHPSFRHSLKNTHVILANNEETAALLKRYNCGKPLLISPVTYFSNQDLDAFKEVRAQRQSRGNPLRIFVGGTFEGRKGITIALHAIARAIKAGLDCRYTIAGSGPELQSLKNLASSLGIAAHVHFHPGFKGADYLRELMETDIYLMPSLRETLSIALVEAILCGCFPIVADTSATGDVLRTFNIGARISLTDPALMAEKTASVLLDYQASFPNLHHQNALAISAIEAHFSMKSYLANIERAYQLALQKGA
jgi:glycosyltransferase involved in cell wall biosynthesis